ncbi:hypothetical protein [Schumannella soli]|uniref:Uncharacterized protein n=1 Tax=Schumannella soli TaxID=2590779 RepID=A0A506YA19_9MICO|nr:hypothetical protein [Schumannella soli]TPW77988.1 hypothetical protein FJ657_04975 [Schumannella soli]
MEIEPTPPDSEMPATLTDVEAFTTALHMVQIYGDVEDWASTDIRRIYDFLRSGDARWDAWQAAVAAAIADPSPTVEDSVLRHCGELQTRSAFEEAVRRSELPDELTLEAAFAATLVLVADFGEDHGWGDEADLVLFHEYLRSDPARWSDWKCAVARTARYPQAATNAPSS